jgi:opacity protein-like surface antigen
MTFRNKSLLAASALMLASAVHAQERAPGWEFGLDVIYQDSQSANFDGGSTIETDSDYGLSATFGYRINSRLEVGLALDWQDIDYRATLIPQVASGRTINARASLEAFTPRAYANFNFMEGPFTPFVTGAVGWSFIDTNIPSGLPQDYCWFDPWWGPVCVRDQPTASVDELAYDLGVGVRLDVRSTFSLRLAYERHWVDYDKASSTPEFDQLKLGIAIRY